MMIILKTTDFKADEIRMRAFSPGGNSLFPDNEILQIKVLNDVAGLGGLGNFSNVDLEKVLAGKKASISTAVNGLSEIAQTLLFYLHYARKIAKNFLSFATYNYVPSKSHKY